MKIKNSLVLIIVLFGFQACYYDVEERLYPTGGCDISNVTLSAKVKPILQGRCYTCHSTQNATGSGAGINLETYATLKVQVDNGKLLKSINHEAGASAMPKGVSAKISACEIKMIDKWVTDGAKDN